MQAQIDAMEKRMVEQETKQQKVASDVAAQKDKAGGLGKAVQVYGQARVSADNRSGDWPSGQDGTEIVSNASRLGVKGEIDTNIADTAMIYQLEIQYETAGETDADEFSFREGYAGLKGGWGKMRMGRLSTGYKSTGTKIDPWTDNAPQARSGGRQGMSELHSNYFNNAVEYVTPKLFEGFTANGWFSTRFDDSDDRMHNAGALTNFRGGDAGGIGVKYEAGPVFVGIDWLDINADTITSSAVSNGDAWQIGARYKVLDDLSFAAMYEDAKGIDLGENYYANAIYRIDKFRLIGAYGQTDGRVPNGDDDWSNWSLGVKYDLTKRSELLAAWNRRMNDTDDTDFDTVTVGINAKFGY